MRAVRPPEKKLSDREKVTSSAIDSFDTEINEVGSDNGQSTREEKVNTTYVVKRDRRYDSTDKLAHMHNCSDARGNVIFGRSCAAYQLLHGRQRRGTEYKDLL